MVKKGFLKTMEVFLAVTGVLIFVMFVNSNNIFSNSNVEYVVLSNLAKDDLFREELFKFNNLCYNKGDSEYVMPIIDEIMPNYLNYTLCVNEDVDFRVSQLPAKRIYVDSYYFSSNEYEYGPRIARLFYWVN